MKMPPKIEHKMVAVCGMNCKVCYKHLAIGNHTKSCHGCKFQDETLPHSCRNCKLVSCANEKKIAYCYQCDLFPCKRIKNLEKSYLKRYDVSLVKNSRMIKENGIETFLQQDRKKWTCQKCNGIISLHDKVCSHCLERDK